MKKAILLFVLFFLSTVTQAKPILFHDSVTNVQIFIPDSCKTKFFKSSEFRKFYAEWAHNALSYYSMKDPKGKLISWQRINNFDNNGKFGRYLGTEKIEGTGLEGWYRYYEHKNFINCITILRGKDYVCYLYETAPSKKELIMPTIIKQSSFVEKPKWRKLLDYAKLNYAENAFYLFWGALLFMVLFFFIKKYIGKFSKTIVGICLITTITVCGTLSAYDINDSIGWIITYMSLYIMLAICVWTLVIILEHVSDLWNYTKDIIQQVVDILFAKLIG